MTIRLLGSSHANALRFAYESGHANHPLDLQIRGLAALKNFHEQFHIFDGKKITFSNQEIAHGFKQCFGTDTITPSDKIIGIVAGFSSVRIWGDWGWRHGFSISDANKPKKFHVTKALIYKADQRNSSAWLSFLTDLRKLNLRVILIAAPPPMRIHPSLKSGGDPDVAIHVNHLVNDQWREFCAKNAIAAIEAPQRILDKDGFLLQKYVVDDGKEDWTHGNLSYGREMLQEVLDYFA